MILRFNVANYLSFYELTEFNMISGDVRTKRNHIQDVKGVELLKFSVMYGSNGAGKSNLIRAIETLKDLVLNEKVKELCNDAHRFDSKCYSKPVMFEIEFVTKHGNPFIYGMSIKNDHIENEYLFKSGLGKTKDRLVFERSKMDNKRYKIEVDKSYLKTKEDRSFLELFQNSILESNEVALPKFLDFDNMVNFNNVLDEVYEWITVGQTIVKPNYAPAALVFNLSKHENFLKFSNEFLSSIDVGIKSLAVQEYDLDKFLGVDDDDQKLRKDIIDALESEKYYHLGVDVIAVKEIIKDKKHYKIKRLFIEHASKNDTVRFTLYQESDGTKRIVEYLSMVYQILNTDFFGVFLVDEIERSIHPYLLKEIIKKLVNSDYLTGQLIFTTHESNLLDLNLFRQDEIWLVEKNKSGATSFSVLSDYRIRNDLDIRNGYLKGRFGAIPILANFKDLNWLKYATD